MRLLVLFLTGLLFVINSCEKSNPEEPSYVFIYDRSKNTTHERQALYRIVLPNGWLAKNTTQPVTDTKFPLIELVYEENGETILLTIHNFPYQNASERIPPQAQINRWKKQFNSLDVAVIKPQAFAGFVGQLFWGEGEIKGTNAAMYAWAMQLAQEHEKTLAADKCLSQTEIRSDITLKATGPKTLMNEQQDTIFKLVRSFEYINALPMP